MFSGAEAENEIAKVFKPKVNQAYQAQTSTAIQLMNGDSMQLRPGNLLLHASGSVLVTDIKQTISRGGTTETTVTYITYG